MGRDQLVIYSQMHTVLPGAGPVLTLLSHQRVGVVNLLGTASWTGGNDYSYREIPFLIMIACLNMNNSGNWSLSKRRTALLEPLLTLIRFVFALFHHLVWLIQTLVVLCTRIPMRPSSILLLMWSWLWPNLCDIRPLRLLRISSASSCEPSAKLILVNNNRPEYPLYLTLVNSSSSENMYPSSNAYNGVNQQLKEHHRRAFQLVSRALKLDEQGKQGNLFRGCFLVIQTCLSNNQRKLSIEINQVIE